MSRARWQATFTFRGAAEGNEVTFNAPVFADSTASQPIATPRRVDGGGKTDWPFELDSGASISVWVNGASLTASAAREDGTLADLTARPDTPSVTDLGTDPSEFSGGSGQSVSLTFPFVPGGGPGTTTIEGTGTLLTPPDGFDGLVVNWYGIDDSGVIWNAICALTYVGQVYEGFAVATDPAGDYPGLYSIEGGDLQLFVYGNTIHTNLDGYGVLTAQIDGDGSPAVPLQVIAGAGAAQIVPPTADPHVAGAIWNNLGVLSISAG